MKSDKNKKIFITFALAIILLLTKMYFDKSNSDFISKDDNILESQEEISKEEINDLINKVHISGEINNPGVYEIGNDDRLEDLVKKAGGLTDLADVEKINLAQRLEDQMRIIIPNLNDPETNVDNSLNATNSSSSYNKKININTADKDELTKLPNIGDKRADAIIEYRETKRFEKIEDIKNVSGIGEKYFEQMKDLIVTN